MHRASLVNRQHQRIRKDPAGTCLDTSKENDGQRSRILQPPVLLALYRPHFQHREKPRHWGAVVHPQEAGFKGWVQQKPERGYVKLINYNGTCLLSLFKMTKVSKMHWLPNNAGSINEPLDNGVQQIISFSKPSCRFQLCITWDLIVRSFGHQTLKLKF